MKKPTIADVAKQAAVSTASVSHVLTGKGRVSEKTRQHILKTMQEMGYYPDSSAQSLSNGRSGLIALTLPVLVDTDTVGMIVNGNPVWQEFLSGMMHVFHHQGYDIIIKGMNFVESFAPWLQRRKPEGIIMLGAYNDGILEQAKRLNIAVVLADVYYEGTVKDLHAVRTDDEQGAYLATRHLLGLGHRRIGFATGNIQSSPVNTHRYMGYIRALAEAGIPLDRRLIYEDTVSYDGGYAIGRLLGQMDEPPTAVFAVSDIMAIGVMKAANECQLTVPQKLSVVGFDDIQLCAYSQPALTTIHQDIHQKGRKCSQLLLDMLEGKTPEPGAHVFTPELVIRSSTAAPFRPNP